MVIMKVMSDILLSFKTYIYLVRLSLQHEKIGRELHRLGLYIHLVRLSLQHEESGSKGLVQVGLIYSSRETVLAT